jgi:hypothetical protein
MVFSAAAAAVVVAVLVRLLLRRAGYADTAGLFWLGALALGGGVAAYLVFDPGASADQTADRRAIEARSAELTARALTPGSPLGCLDAVENALIENACEKSLFASAEAVAAAVAYVDARVSLLAGSASLAKRDAAYRPTYERLRRGLESDRYGIVAHVLTTRGCNVAECPEIHLLGNSAHVLANIKSHAFETALGVHALTWPNGGDAAVASALPAVPPAATTGVAPPMASVMLPPPAMPAMPTGKFDYPSAGSIPPVSIMTPEPGPPVHTEAAKPSSAPPAPSAPLPSKRQMVRRSNSQEGMAPSAAKRTPSLAGAHPAASQPPPPPTQIAPAAPESDDPPDTHATR